MLAKQLLFFTREENGYRSTKKAKSFLVDSLMICRDFK